MNTNYEDVIQKSGSTTFDSTASKSLAYLYGGDWYRYGLVYDGSNWDLVFRSLGGFVSSTTAMQNTAAASAAAVLDANSSVAGLFNVGTDEEFSNAASQSLPLLVGGGQAAASPSLSAVGAVIGARLSGDPTKMAGDGFDSTETLWIKPFGSWADQNDQGSVSGFSAGVAGVAIGTEAAVSNDVQVGVSFAYANTSATGSSDAAPHSASVDLYKVTGYVGLALEGATQINYQLGFGKLRTLGQRDILLADVTARSDYESSVVTATADASRTYQHSATTSITPTISAAYTWIKDDAYLETGAGDLNLLVNERTSCELILRADGRIDHKLATGAVLSGNFGIGYDVMQSQNSITAAFTGAPNATFTTLGLDPSPWVASGGLGFAQKTADGMKVSTRYDIAFNNGSVSQTASLNLRLDF